MGLRRRRRGTHEAENLTRFRADVASFMRLPGGATEGPDSPVAPPDGSQKVRPQYTMTRKERRKEARKLGKMRKNAFLQKKPLPTAEGLERERAARGEKVRKRREKEEKREERREERQREREQRQQVAAQQREEEEEREELLRSAQRADDREIKQLEKQLRLRKRKSKTMPLGFLNDGLDFILNVVDAEKLKEGMDEEGEEGEGFIPRPGGDTDEEESEDGDDSDDEDESMMSEDDLPANTKAIPPVSLPDVSQVKGVLKGKSLGRTEKNVRFAELGVDRIDDEDVVNEDEDEDEELLESGDEMDEADSDETDNEINDDVADEIEQMSNDEDERDDKIDEEASNKEAKLKEDIYGRLRDAGGNVVTAETGSYVPPGRRLLMADGDDSLALERIRKRLRGLINRLSEGTLPSIATQIEGMFVSGSRARLCAALTAAVFAACVSSSLIADRLVSEHALLLALLHRNISSEVGAVCLQRIADQFQAMYEPAGGATEDDKSLDNLLVLLCQLYNFKVVHSLLIFDVMKKLADRFNDKDVELLLVILRNVGFGLRKDDAASLKEMIVTIQTKAAAADKTLSCDKSRVAFMMEILLAIRNNNMRKIPNYDPSHVEHLKKLLRSLQRVSGDNQLRVSLDDLLNSQHKGRWWVVGSAWTGGVGERPKSDEGGLSVGSLDGYTAEILELARRQRMNTDVRKNIFCILMTSEDFADAFEKLLRLGLKHAQEREIIHVAVDLCLQGATFNPYYAYLIQKFCECDRRFQMTVQFNMWDKFKELTEFKVTKRRNLSALLSHLITRAALSLSVFKVLQWEALDDSTSRLVRRTLTQILTNHTEAGVTTTFARVAVIAKLRPLCDGLRFSLGLLRGATVSGATTQGADGRLLEERISLAMTALVAAKMRM